MSTPIFNNDITKIRIIFHSNLQSRYGKATWPIAAVICVYYTIVFISSYNYPIADDFYLVDFVTNITTSSDLTKSLALLYAQHNEHRIITTKLIFLLDYWSFGKLNFRHLIMIGNLFHLATFYIFIKHSPRQFDQRSYFAIFMACMIFQFGSAESMLWSMAAISNYLVLTLALFTLSLLSKDSLRYFALAIVFSILAVFTQGNGILIPFIAVIYLLSQKRYLNSLIMAVIAIMAVLAYFSDYQVPLQHANPLNSIHDIGKLLVFAVSFTGSAFGVGGSHYPVLTDLSLIPTLIVGGLIWCVTGYGFYKKTYYDGNIFIWFNLFIIISAIITGLSRLNFGLSLSMVSRYHINSNLALISTVVLALQLFPIKQYSKHALDHVFKMLAIFSAAYVVATLAFVAYFYFVVYVQIHSNGIIFPDKNQAIMILDRAKSNGVFAAQ
jgi:hypothetical protein